MSNGALCATRTAPRENSRNAGSTCSIRGCPRTIELVIPVRAAMNAGTGPPGSTRVWNSPSISPPRTFTAPISVMAAAVKVRGGEMLGEFQTLVDPGGPVPAFIAALTGITSSMVRGQPRIEQVLPAFLEFSRGAVLVAHNAPFDIGFLKAAARNQGYPWPGNQVLDTVALARRAVTRDEVPNHKLSTLAAFFRTAVAPEHRALSDARATVDVLHACLARLGPLGITHLDDGLPDAPGVYQFRGAGGEVLYVGTATSIRSRVRSYFTAAEQRRRMTEMVGLAEQVVPIVCASR